MRFDGFFGNERIRARLSAAAAHGDTDPHTVGAPVFAGMLLITAVLRARARGLRPVPAVFVY